MNVDRILDCEANRVAEGLRVLEEVARFLLAEVSLAAQAKELRHRLRQALPARAVAGRDAEHDPGRTLTASNQAGHTRLTDLLRANAARVQEGLRSLEEFGRLAEPALATAAAELRFAAYTLESHLLARLPAWRLASVRLYVIVDTTLAADPLAVAAAAIRGGAGIIQLRAKDWNQRSYYDLAARMLEVVRTAGGLFVVNDHVAVAAALGADAVHVGQDDLAPHQARRALPATCAIGVSCHQPDQVAAAQAAGADYVGLGPMYPTASKAHEPVRGPDLLDQARPLLRIPSFAIGGLDAARIHDLRPRLPHGVAVAGAVCRSADPQAAAAHLCRVLEAADGRI